MNEQDLTEKITKSISQFFYKTNLYSKARITTGAMCSIAFFCGVNICLTILLNYKLDKSKKENNNLLNDTIEKTDAIFFKKNEQLIQSYNHKLDSLYTTIISDNLIIKDQIKIIHNKVNILLDCQNKVSISDLSILTDDTQFVTKTKQLEKTNNHSDYSLNEYTSTNKIISEDDESYDADELLNECYDSIPCNNNKKIINNNKKE